MWVKVIQMRRKIITRINLNKIFTPHSFTFFLIDFYLAMARNYFFEPFEGRFFHTWFFLFDERKSWNKNFDSHFSNLKSDFLYEKYGIVFYLCVYPFITMKA